MRKHFPALAAIALSVVLSQVCLAAPSQQDILAAREAERAGAAAEKDGAWQAARDAYQKALNLQDTIDTRLRLARAEARLGRIVEAADHYRIVIDAKGAPPSAKAAAQKELAAVVERIPLITVQVPAGFSGTVHIDKMEITAESLGKPIEVSPGTRIVAAEAKGYEPFSRSVVMGDRGREVVDVKLVPVHTAVVSTNDGATRRTIGYVSLAVGGAGLIVGAGFGIASRSTRDDLRTSCPDKVCPVSLQDDYDKGRMQATVANIGFVTAGVGAVLGTVLLLTAPKKREPGSASVTPYVGLGSVGVGGEF